MSETTATAALLPAVRQFLSAGTRTGKLGFVAADGRPLVAPVWFVVEGPDEAPELLFNTGRDTAKGRAVLRDPRLCLCVDEEAAPYAFVQVQGEATISEEPAELVRSATAIAARYMGVEQSEEFGRRNAVPGELLVRLRPIRVLANMNMTA
jgi:PPOX class probable F420-dependent enzyme